MEHIHESLVEKGRKVQGKTEEPGVGIIDAQSVKNTLVSGQHKGFDPGKKIKGIKRHIILDTLDLILAVVIQNASVQDRNGGVDVVGKRIENWRKVIKIFANGRYSGTLEDKIKKRFNIVFEIIKRDRSSKFKALPKRWIVERTFSWIDTNRRTAKHDERLNDSGVAMVHLSAIRIMPNRF